MLSRSLIDALVTLINRLLAITNFTRSLALEYGSRGVRINAVPPSLISTVGPIIACRGVVDCLRESV
jgi:enoyl-[acyl-carrier-protein] reductase (NADH)